MIDSLRERVRVRRVRGLGCFTPSDIVVFADSVDDRSGKLTNIRGLFITPRDKAPTYLIFRFVFKYDFNNAISKEVPLRRNAAIERLNSPAGDLEAVLIIGRKNMKRGCLRVVA